MARRDRGIISHDDRRYLKGLSDMEYASSERKARMRIRNRIRDALLDFSILMENLETRDREQVFFRSENMGRDFSHDLEDALVDAVALFYLGLSDVAESTGKPTDEWFSDIFRRGLEKGIRNWSKESRDEGKRVLTDFTLEFEHESEALVKAKHRYTQGEELEAKDIVLLVNAGIISDDSIFSH